MSASGPSGPLVLDHDIIFFLDNIEKIQEKFGLSIEYF